MELKVIVEKVNKLLVCPQIIISQTYEIIIKSDYHTEIQLLYVTRSEKTDHVLHATKNEIMIVLISTSFLLAHIKINNCHSHLVCLLFTLWPFLCLVTFLMFFITCLHSFFVNL